MFEIDAAHVDSMLPCPECGRMLDNYDPNAPATIEDADATQALVLPDGGGATTMLRVPDTKKRRHFDVPTQAVALDQLEGSVDVPPPDPSVEIPTQAYRTAPVQVDEEAPTKAIHADALRKAITEGMMDDAPTRALDANALRAGAAALPPEDDSTRAWTKPVVDNFGEDAPTRALRMPDSDVLTSAMPPAGASGPIPARRPAPAPSGGPLRGVSGPLPKRRPRKPKPAPAPPPARPLEGPPAARPLNAPPPARPLEAPPPARPIAAPVAAPVAQKPAPPPAAPVAAPVPAAAGPQLPPPPEPAAEEHSYFDQSRAIDLPDALGALLDAGPEPVGPKNRPTVARTTRKKSKRTLLIIVSVFVLLIVGAIVLVMTRETDPSKKVLANQTDPEAPISDAVDEGAESQKAFNRALTRNKARLPAVTQGEMLEEGDFIIAGPDGVVTQKGPVVGLIHTPFPDSSLTVEAAGEEAKPLLGAFRGGGDKPLYVAVDRRVKARTVAQIINSAKRAGYGQISLVGRRGGDSGELIGLPVKPHTPDTPPPSAGGVELRIGQRAINLAVKGRDGQLMGERPPQISQAGGSFDFNALDALLDQLSSTHPMVRSVVVYTNGTLGLETLMGVLGRVRGSDTRDRFPAISLSVK